MSVRAGSAPEAGATSSPVVEVVVDDTVVAAVASHAARGVVGVSRLETGVGGLLGRLAARARHQVQQGPEGEPARTDGVSVDSDSDGDSAGGTRVHVDLGLVVGADVTAVSHAVQAAVAAALHEDLGVRPVQVSVSVLDIDVAGPDRVPPQVRA